ncbi:hypothetical protein JB92DRAFT_3098220 [Gautieria morchelliformis]|nr:hypothetical protein JB92DRAFT_3098220 [Gautieria morchelliformis]
MAISTFISTCIVLLFGYQTVAGLVKKHLRGRLTAMDDLSLLGVPRKDGGKLSGTAVICGGSIAGLLSARVCANHFEHVIMVEPEEWVTTPEGLVDHPADSSAPKRARVSQFTSFHSFQTFLTLALRKLFPTFDHELAKVGSLLVSGNPNVHISGLGVKPPWDHHPVHDYQMNMNLSRAAFEPFLRRLVLDTCHNVEYMTGTVTGFVRGESAPVRYEKPVGMESSDTIPTATPVAAVRIRSRDGEENILPAALVVGPAIGGFRWLQSLNQSPSSLEPASDAKEAQFEAPNATLPSDTESSFRPMKNDVQNPPSQLPLSALRLTYDHRMAYTTCSFDVPPHLVPKLMELGFPSAYATAGLVYLSVPNPRVDKRNVIIARKGPTSLVFTLGGWDVRSRIVSLVDVRSFLSQMTLAAPLPVWIGRVLEIFEEEDVPLECVHARSPPSVYIRYHLSPSSIPHNFVAVGDSVLQLNPVRGHGCTKACVDAVTLDGLLRKLKSAPSDRPIRSGSHAYTGVISPDFSRAFFRSQALRTGGLWKSYTSQDYRFPTTTPAHGDTHSTGSWQRQYGVWIATLAMKDQEVSEVWWRVVNWLNPPTDLYSPVIVFKIARMVVGGFLRA